jgi:ubiquinone/menaquinone biosynthesis methyltransferase
MKRNWKHQQKRKNLVRLVEIKTRDSEKMASILHGSRLALRRTIQGRSSEFSQLRLSFSFSTNTSENNVNDATTHFGFTTVRTEEKESKVREVFESVAESYDVMNDLMSGGLHRLWKDDLLHRTGLAPTSRALRRLHHASAASDQTTPPPTLNVLDVAGGTGDVAFRFIEAAGCHERSKSSGQDPIQVTVCDINAEMLRVGERRARQRYGSGLLDETKALSFVEGNAQTLPFEDNSFDLYTIAFGLRNVTHVDMALKDAFRVLKPGGRFMCLEFSHVTNPAFRAIYDTYSFHVIPTIGDIVANDRASYQYLVESIRKFSNQDELASRLDRAGFSGAKYTNMTGGIVALHEGWKPV